MTSQYPPLYHFTCDHRAPLIRDEGVVVPGHHQNRDAGYATTAIPWAAFAWFTDLAVPAREPLGLTMELLRCDRTEYRFRALDGTPLVPWLTVRKQYPWRVFLESAGTRPVHWFVSTEPVPVVEAPPACRVCGTHYASGHCLMCHEGADNAE